MGDRGTERLDLDALEAMISRAVGRAPAIFADEKIDARIALRRLLAAARRAEPEPVDNDVLHTLYERIYRRDAEIERLEGVLRDLLAHMAVQFEDPRLRYVVMQVDREALADARAALENTTPKGAPE